MFRFNKKLRAKSSIKNFTIVAKLLFLLNAAKLVNGKIFLKT